MIGTFFDNLRFLTTVDGIIFIILCSIWVVTEYFLFLPLLIDSIKALFGSIRNKILDDHENNQ